MMGHSGTVPSAIDAADVPAALARLRSAVADISPPPPEEDGENHERSIGLAVRAYPLIELLEAAAAEKCAVMWR
jgi:hypothetical protein